MNGTDRRDCRKNTAWTEVTVVTEVSKETEGPVLTIETAVMEKTIVT